MPDTSATPAPNYSEDQRAVDEEIARKQQARAALPQEARDALEVFYDEWGQALDLDPEIRAKRQQAVEAHERGEPVHFDIRKRAEQLRRGAFAWTGDIFKRLQPRTAPRARGVGRPAGQPRSRSSSRSSSRGDSDGSGSSEGDGDPPPPLAPSGRLILQVGPEDWEVVG